MTVPTVTTGRGAFTAIGKDNGSRYYEYIAGKPLDGGKKTVDTNYQAVNLGVKAIQARINAYGYTPPLTEDGVLGGKTKTGIEWIQRRLALFADGQAGPLTCRSLWRDIITWVAVVKAVPGAHLWGIMLQESVADPGAVGYSTPSDRGLFQINLAVHTEVTSEMAYDPGYAADYTAQRLASARAKFSAKGTTLQTQCSIAQHNSPAAAASWYKTGTPPNEKIAAYVDKVLTHAKTF